MLRLSSYTFPEVAAYVLHLFSGIEEALLREMMAVAFANFNPQGSQPLPILKVDDISLLDLSLGPTMAFKDIVRVHYLL